MADNFMERSNNGAIATAHESKEVAEVKAKVFLARQFPRNEELCLARILRECESVKLAEVAQYSYPKGGTEVKGPSIRLIEVISRHWGNMLSGVTELNKTAESATFRTYAWDLETNYADEKIFEMPFIRNLKGGKSYVITDDREKYELVANYAARRKRACIQAIIPGYIIDEAAAACERTLEAHMNKGTDGKEKTIEELRVSMSEAFKALLDWVTEEMLAGICGKDFDKLGKKDIVKLRNLYNAIKDGFAKPEVVFGKEKEDASIPAAEETEELDKLNEQLKAGKVPNGTDEG